MWIVGQSVLPNSSACERDERLIVALSLADLPRVVGARDRIPQGREC
jgi:hypothetical protein